VHDRRAHGGNFLGAALSLIRADTIFRCIDSYRIEPMSPRSRWDNPDTQKDMLLLEREFSASFDKSTVHSIKLRHVVLMSKETNT
jgi:hypothetical protein